MDVVKEIQSKAKQIGQEAVKKKPVKKTKKGSRKRRVPEKLDVIEEEEEVEVVTGNGGMSQPENGAMEEEDGVYEGTAGENPDAHTLSQSIPEEPSEIQLDQPPDESKDIEKLEESEPLESAEEQAGQAEQAGQVDQAGHPEEANQAEQTNHTEIESNQLPTHSEEPSNTSEVQKETDSDSFFDEPEYSIVCCLKNLIQIKWMKKTQQRMTWEK